MRSFPCGRTEEDAWLCCRRQHKWYDTKLKICYIRLCKHPIKYKKLFIVQSEIYCRYCGSCISSSVGQSLWDTIVDYFRSPYWF